MGELRKALLRHNKANTKLRRIERDLSVEVHTFSIFLLVFIWAVGGILLATGAVFKFHPLALAGGFIGTLVALFLRHCWNLRTLNKKHEEGIEELDDAFIALLDIVRRDEIRSNEELLKLQE